MSLTELQMPTKTDLYNTLRNSASELSNLMHRCQELAKGINLLDTSDIDALAIPTGVIRTDMINFKTALNELVAFYYGTGITRTNVPEVVIAKIRLIK